METRTEKVLPQMVDAVQGDFAWAADTLDGVIAHLERLEPLLRFDAEARQCCAGTSEALGGFVHGLRKGSAALATRVLPRATTTGVVPIELAREIA